MKIDLSPGFLNRPIAHRAFHDVTTGRPENSIAAIEAAIEHGFGIEIDVQLTSDAAAVVFHDYDLDRLTEAHGKVSAHTQSEMSSIPLVGGGRVPSLDEVLRTVDGRVPLLIEIKDQDGALGPKVGPLEQAVAEAVSGYDGPVAVMSFNPHSVAAIKALSPNVARGLVTTHFLPEEWSASEDRLVALRAIPDFDGLDASFISHDARDLQSSHVARLKNEGAHILCWTIRSPEQEADARLVADNVTFEGYFPVGTP